MGTGHRNTRTRRTVLHQPRLTLRMEHAITAAALLNVWEQGRTQSQVQRALSLLALAAGSNPPGEVSQFSIGRRDAELLRLRETLFGHHMAANAGCPGCQQTVELNFKTADIRAEPGGERREVGLIQLGDYEIEFRLPNSEDLAALPAGSEVETQKRFLVLRCITRAAQQGEPFPTSQINSEMIEALSSRMAELDPQGDVQLTLTCPHCGHHWRTPLDIVSFLWSEIHSCAQRLLREVHAIAIAYSWREGDILAMSPLRRQSYLELIGQ